MVGRIPIVDVSPVIDCGRLPAKAVAGETFAITATVFREGHDRLGAGVVLRGPDDADRPLRFMQPTGRHQDEWQALVTPDTEGSWTFTVESWSDPVGSWRHDAEIKIPAEIDVELMLAEGARVLERALAALPTAAQPERTVLRDAITALRDTSRPVQARFAAGVGPDVDEVLDAYPLRELVTREGPFPFYADRERALFSSWYEFFPRSEGARYDERTRTWTSGTFRTAARRLDGIAAMGFDVVYLPPVHPIGKVNRKGPNNALVCHPGDPGSPWAIGSDEGGHDAVHPDLGTIDDFDAFVARARELGLEVALDLALQCAPDHPWARKHPEWFTTRADGSIAYAENPPKKYQDIYPLNFDKDPEGIYAEVLRVVRHWMDHGVRIFRVDNPHTKPVPFWQRLLAEIRETDPDVIMLSEAFTKPAMMRTLGMIGFHQSYTYFTWRNERWELEEYLTELAHDSSPILRPNLFVNTPDILHAYLQYGGPAAFKVRATLAATASPSWGVYSGFELYEHVAVRPGSEEYLDSEKYQFRPRDWAQAEAEGRSLAPYLTQLNRIRREHRALQRLRNIAFHHPENQAIIAYSKREGDDTLIVVINLDPHATHETMIRLDLPALGMDWHDTFLVHDEISDQTWRWGEYNYVRLDPAFEPAHVLTVRRTH